MDSQPRPLPCVVSRFVYYLKVQMSIVIMQDGDQVINTKEGVWKRQHHTQETSAEGNAEEDDAAQGTWECYVSKGI